MKVLIAVQLVPEYAEVTKRNGDKVYTVRDDLNVYYSHFTEPKTIPSIGGARFLADKNGNATAVNGDLEVLWYTDIMEYNSVMGY